MSELARAWSAFGAFLLGSMTVLELPLQYTVWTKVIGLSFVVAALVVFYASDSDE